MHWSILYRGSLSSCNYACTYCPFAKTRNTRAELAQDAAEVKRFVEWVGGRGEEISVLFTPWGEALGHRHYQQAISTLSRMNNVRKVAIQTNLSAPLHWLNECNVSHVGLWATWHPDQTRMDQFLRQCSRAEQYGARFSVGVVGIRSAFDAIENLRAALPEKVYLWINAWKREAGYYSEEEMQRLEAVDPLFRINAVRHHSHGKSCHAGHSVFTVDGNGAMRRCHFIKQVFGNIYQPEFETTLQPKLCTNENCGCHIGYVHFKPLDLYSVFGDGVLERIPEAWPQGSARMAAHVGKLDLTIS